MSRAYSEDLRIRVVRYVEGGASRRSAAKPFGVSPSIAVKWLQRWRLKKSVAPSRRGHRRAVLDRYTDWLMDLVKEKPDITLAEIAAKLSRRGVRVSLSNDLELLRPARVQLQKKAYTPASRIVPTWRQPASAG